jgi:hypothetical protein
VLWGIHEGSLERASLVIERPQHLLAPAQGVGRDGSPGLSSGGPSSRELSEHEKLRSRECFVDRSFASAKRGPGWARLKETKGIVVVDGQDTPLGAYLVSRVGDARAEGAGRGGRQTVWHAWATPQASGAAGCRSGLRQHPFAPMARAPGDGADYPGAAQVSGGPPTRMGASSVGTGGGGLSSAPSLGWETFGDGWCALSGSRRPMPDSFISPVSYSPSGGF